jgi:ATP adenylyltransferase
MNCCICSQIAGDSSNDLFAKAVGAGPYVRRVPLETENFAVIPSLGPLAPGHVILCPKEHYRSFASIPSRHDNEYESLLSTLKNLLRGLYSTDVHLFEHGMAADASRMLCTVDHAHLHVLPASVSVTKILEPYPHIPVGAGLAGLRHLAQTEEYVFYESPTGDRRLIPARDQPLESQYLRQVFAKTLGHACEWNWRDHMKVVNAHETYEKIAASVAPTFV